jgi:hypothetical protein
MSHVREPLRPRTIVIRHGGGWQSLAFLCLCLILLGLVLLGHEALRGIDRQNQQAAQAMARVEHRMQQLESGIVRRPSRWLLLAMRSHPARRPHQPDRRLRYADLALSAARSTRQEQPCSGHRQRGEPLRPAGQER